MSKQMIKALIDSQYKALASSDNKERLKYMVAGIKDGRFYNHSGTDYGQFDEDIPDAEFITDADIALTRITSSRIQIITSAKNAFFEKYMGDAQDVEDAVDDAQDVEDAVDDAVDDAQDVEDVDAVESATKKAIKKGDFKKAQKLIDRLGGHKKLQKRLDKANVK